MRYQEKGELHLDFHGATATTIDYILRCSGKEALRKIMTRTARRVYREIYDALQAGDTVPLLEHWQYFFTREGGDFSITRQSNGDIVLEVKRCPAVRRLMELGMEVNADFCLQTQMINEALSENSPFDIHTEKRGECSCTQTIALNRRRKTDNTMEAQKEKC